MYRSAGYSGFRVALIQVLIYTSLTLMPAKMPVAEILPASPHAIVQPTTGPDSDLDELIASLVVDL